MLDKDQDLEVTMDELKNGLVQILAVPAKWTTQIVTMSEAFSAHTRFSIYFYESFIEGKSFDLCCINLLFSMTLIRPHRESARLSFADFVNVYLADIIPSQRLNAESLAKLTEYLGKIHKVRCNGRFTYMNN
jgi:hypothetical protein